MNFNSLNLPTTNSAVTDAVNSANSSLNQSITSFSTASDVQKQGELLTKLSTTGNSSNFTAACSSIDIMPMNNTVTAVDAISKTPIAPLNATPEAMPASAVPNTGDNQTDSFKVKIWQDPQFDDGLPNMVILEVMPTIDESQSINYDSFSPIQHPGEIQKYRGTGARTWSISTRLISRTMAEAEANLYTINIIRSWAMPFYGQGTAKDPTVSSYLGAPPPVLNISGYGDYAIGGSKCVLTHYSWTWPNDVDYIPTSTGDPFPVIITISLGLTETWSPAEFSNFSISDYRLGQLEDAFGFTSTRPGNYGNAGGQPVDTSQDNTAAVREEHRYDNASIAQDLTSAQRELKRFTGGLSG